MAKTKESFFHEAREIDGYLTVLAHFVKSFRNVGWQFQVCCSKQKEEGNCCTLTDIYKIRQVLIFVFYASYFEKVLDNISCH